jgi:beta-lactamase class A
MRLAGLLLCLAVAGCASTGSDDALNAASPAAAAAAPAAAAEPPAPAAAPSQPASASAAEKPAAPSMTPAERLTQARVDCWMRVEKDRSVARNIDRRIALVDKCVAEKTKAAR